MQNSFEGFLLFFIADETSIIDLILFIPDHPGCVEHPVKKCCYQLLRKQTGFPLNNTMCELFLIKNKINLVFN